MKRPLIGFKLKEKDLKEFSLKKFPFETFEIGRHTRTRFNIRKIISRIKEPMEGIRLSLHSNVGLLFSCTSQGYPEFREAEINLLKADIISSKIAGIDRIVFHAEDRIFSKEEKEEFKEVVEFANKNKIKLLIESNSFAKAKYALDFLESFPEVDYCLDMGHVNTSIINDIFGMDLMDFIKKINTRIIHIHAHNNYGNKDAHDLIDEGNFPYEEVLKNLNHVERIIFEAKSLTDALHNKKVLEEFYGLKSKPLSKETKSYLGLK